MLTSCQNFSESKISCWHSLNFPNGGKRSDVPSQTKHWETLQGEYYYPHLSADEMETQEVKILCPGSTAWKNWPECQKQHCVAPPAHGCSLPCVMAPLWEWEEAPPFCLTRHHFPSSRTVVNWFSGVSISVLYFVLKIHERHESVFSIEERQKMGLSLMLVERFMFLFFFFF